ncbi:MAG: zinc ribbon domain-containing protein [Bryobacteraceae bacterium]|jgi:putative FmdB family regulatory protein
MPIYEYACESCGNKFEKLVRRSEDVLESGCPSCGQKHLKQEYSTFAARASAGNPAPSPAGMGGCPAGMCATPGLCGRN